ncbi:MAG: DUF4430 domain-containing protein [Clostridiales bacterium]|nr:DUF4430 domain-containing protein [Clostridiales bacterium]
MFLETNKASKVLVLILTIAMIITGFWAPENGTLNAYADEGVENLSDVVSIPALGDGTEENPYVIHTAEELVWFAEEANKDLGSCAVLEDNIQLSGNEDKQWTPIGSAGTPYTGTFDGRGHTVSGIYINKNDGSKYLGFFGNLGSGGIVKKLSVKGSISTETGGATYTGGLVGCANSGSQIVNCASYVTVNAIDGTTVGGLVGGTEGSNYATNAKISGSFNAGKVSGKMMAGGIVGNAKFAEISYCYNRGDISTAKNNVGGILGYTSKSYISSLQNSYNTGSITGSGNVGALAGYQDGISVTANDCYWLDISSEKGFGSMASVSGTNEAKSAADMKSVDFVALINGANSPQESKFMAVDGEYPMHKWQHPEMSDEDAVSEAAGALNLDTSTPVTDDLTLPLTGINGTAITWRSSNDTVLSDGGLLNPPDTEITITLTATVSKNSVQETKDFVLIVAAKNDNSDTEAVEQAAQSFPSLLIPENTTDTNFIAFINRLLEKKGFSGINVKITNPGTPSKDDVGSIAANGDITYFYQEPSSLGYNTPYVFVNEIKLTLSKGSVSKEVIVRARLDWDKDKVQNWLTEAVLNTINWESIRESNTDQQAVMDSLSLPVRKRDTQSNLLANLTWSSSDTSVIQIAKGEVGSDAPVIATVKCQAEDRDVILTVSAENTKAQGITAIKTITLKVKGDGTSLSEQQKMQALLDKHYTDDCITLASTGEKITGPVHEDVMIPKHSRAWFDEISGLEFATDISEPNSESSTKRNYDFKAMVTDSQYSIPVYPRINVYRPLPGQSVATVHVTVIMTKVDDKSISASKVLTFQVAPWEQQELNTAITDATELMNQAKTNYAAALLNGTKNTADNITENLIPFRRVTLQEGKTVFSNNMISSGSYLIADEFPGYDPMKVYSGGYRTFRSSQEKTIANETLQLVGTVPEDKQITITAWLTHSQLGRYWEKYGAAEDATLENKEVYKEFKDFYKNEVNAIYMVKGIGGELDPAGSSAEIIFAFSYDGAFEVKPTAMKVDAGYASRFDIGEESTGPTVLDAAVMAHKQKYGDAFTSSTVQNYMNEGLTRLFGHGNGKDTYFGHYINGAYSADMAGEAKLKDGDLVYLYNYGNWNGSATANFYQEGSSIFDVVTTNGSLSLNLMKAPGYGETEATPAGNVQIGVMNEGGKLSGDKIVSTVQTNSDGSFTLHFTENGTFFIMCANSCDSKTLYPAWCEVNVSGVMTDAEMREIVEQDKAALNVNGLNLDGTPSTSQLILASQGVSGKSIIRWQSNITSIVTNDGQVIKDSQTHTVKLTAVISCGNVSDCKEFIVQVPALTDNEVTESLNNAKSRLTSEALAPVEYDGFDEAWKQGYYIKSKNLDTNILSKATGAVDNPEINVEIDSSSNSAVDIDGKITYGSNAVTGDVVFGLTIGGQTQQHTVSLTVPAHLKNKMEYMTEVLGNVNFEQVKGKNLTSDDIKLPLFLPNALDVDEKLYSMAEINAEWTSDHPEVIKVPSYTTSSSETNYNAVYKTQVVRPDVKTIVNLTATFSYNTEYDGVMGTLPPGAINEDEITKVITVEVNPLTNEEKADVKSMLNAALDTIGNEKITAYKNNKDSGIAADLTAVTDDLHLYDFDKNSAYRDSGIRVTWSSNNTAITVNTLRAKVSRPIGTQNAVGKLTVTLFKDNISISKDFEVTVLAEPNAQPKVEAFALMNGIASQYATKEAAWWGKIDGGNFWNSVGLEAYRKYQPDTTNVLSKEAKQAFVNKMITLSVDEDTDSVRNANIQANVINGLSALGYDPTNLWTVNHSKINAVEKLKAISISDVKNKSYRTIAPYVLNALKQGDYDTAQQENAHIQYLIEELDQESNWTAVIDYPAMMMQGLAPYYDRAEVKTTLDRAVTKLSAQQGSNGSFGNCNSDAMVIITLAQLGINPAEDIRFVKNGNSLLDGLLLYKTNDNKGFGYTNAQYNEMATSQGLLGLISALNVMDSEESYNVYDFSKTAKTAAYANGTIEGEPEKPVENPDEGKTITVTFTMKADKGTWIPATSVTLKNNSKVYHAFVKVLDDAGFTYVGANKNYVSSITNKNGSTLAEFTKGPNSGWLYKVNGILPNIGLKEYVLGNGDKIVWYYTDDWTKDPGAIEAMGGSSGKTVTEEKANSTIGKVEAEAKTDTNGVASTTISDKDISSAIKETLRKAAESKMDLIKKIAIEVKADSKATKVETIIPRASVAELNKKVDQVMVNTPVANVSLDSQTLKKIAENLKGDVKVTAERTDVQKAIISNEKISPEQQNRIEAKFGGRSVFDFTMQSGTDKITEFAGMITVSIPYKLQVNEKPEGIAVYYISSNGIMTKVPDSKYNNEKVEFMTNHFSYYAVVYEETLKFVDVTSGAWYREAVEYVVKNNLMNGVSATEFKPNDQTTRAMLVTILYNAEGKQEIKRESPFADVNKNTWYGAPVIWASEKEIVKGMSENLFMPATNLSREQVATMLYNYAKFKKLNIARSEASAEKMTDFVQISPWAKDAVNWALDKKIINGKGNNVLDPKGNATRAEIAQMIKNFMEVK